MSEESVVRVVVYGLILRDDKTFLLVQRAADDSMPGIWEMPGGTVEIGEEPAVAALREVLEETGLQVQIKRLLSVKSIYKRSKLTNKMTHTFRIAFLCKLLQDDARVVLSHEHDAYQWVDKTSLPPTMLSDFLKQTVAQAQEEHLV